MFTNYLLDHDKAPLYFQDGSSPTICSEAFCTVPCGRFVKLRRDSNGSFLYFPEGVAVIQEQFFNARRDVVRRTVASSDNKAPHECKMSDFVSALRSAGLFTDTDNSISGDYAGVRFSPMVPPAAPRLLIIRDKTVVELIGENLSLVLLLTAQEHPLKILSATSSSVTLKADVRVIAELSEEYAGGTAFITLQDIFGRCDRGAVPIEVCFADLNHVLPNELISAVTPLTHLLDTASLPADSAVAQHLKELNNQCAKMMGDTVPIEFAFNIMTKAFSSGRLDSNEPGEEIPNSALHTKTDLQWAGNRPVDPLAETRKYLVVFLTKLAFLKIHHDDWQNYCSCYMIEVIMKAIANLQNQSEESIAELESLFYKAIKEDAHRLKTYRFPKIASTRCKYSGDVFFVTAPANGVGSADLPRLPIQCAEQIVDDATLSYWTLICHEKVSAGIIFVDAFPPVVPAADQNKPIFVPGQGSQAHAYFRVTCTSPPEMAHEVAPGWIYGGWKNQVNRVKIAKYSIKKVTEDRSGSKGRRPSSTSFGSSPSASATSPGVAAGTGTPAAPSPPSPEMKEPTPIQEEELTFTQFTFSCQQSSLEIEVDTLMKMIISCSSVVSNDEQAIHVQGADKHFDFIFALLMLWILEERRKDSKPITENAIAKVFKSIKDDLNKSGTLLVQDSVALRLRGVVDRAFPNKHSSSATAYVRSTFSNSSIYRSLGARRSNPRKRVISMLRELSQRMITNYHLASKRYFCGLTVKVLNLQNFFEQHTMGVPGATTARPTADSIIANKMRMIENATHVSYEVRFLTIMMDDMIEMSLGNVIDIARTSTLDIGLHAIRAAGHLLLLGGQWVLAQAQRAIGDNGTAALQVSRQFSSVLESIHHRSENFKTYKGLLDKIIAQADIQLPVGSSYNTLADMEREIFDRLPAIMTSLDLQTLISLADAKEGYFANSPFSALLKSTRTTSVLMVFFKLIAYSHTLKFKRREFKIVTIAGQKNAGKTTLAIKLLGEKVVTATPGDNIEYTTVFPKAYPYASDPSLTFIDLPGCTDECTAGISSMFASSSDISIFLISSKEPKKNSKSLLERTLRLCLEKRRGACLVCINGYDRTIEDSAITREKAMAKLKAEAQEWPAEKFRATQDNEYEAGLEEIRGGAAPFDNSLHSNGAAVDVVRERPIRHWEVEKTKLSCVVYSTGVVAHKPLSVWLTAFDPYFHVETLTKELIFSSDDVKAWINEVKLHQYTS